MTRIPLPHSIVSFALLIAAAGLETTPAHQDPLGDIHPDVRVENGRFVVEFRNNLDHAIDSHDRSRFRMIFRADGTLIAPRHRTRKTDNRYRNPVLAPPRKTRVGKERISFDFHSEQPTALIETDADSRRRVSLPWPEKNDAFTQFNSGTATATHFALLGSRWIDETDPTDRELLLFVFKRGSTDPPAVHRFGKVATIYGPVCSRLIAANGRFWVAWMRIDDAPEKKYDLMLSSAGSRKKDIHSRVLDAPGHWNTKPSIAAIGDRLCIAYHYGPFYGPLQSSRIVTVFEEAVVKPEKE